MQSNESQGQRHPQGDLAKIAAQIDEVTVGRPEKKAKFCTHIQKVIHEAENYGQYLRGEWQKAKDAGWTQYDENKREPEWFLWSCPSWWSCHGFYFSDDEWLQVYFYIKGKPKLDPLEYLDSMIWGAVGQPYEGLELLDYQFVLLAIIYDAQNWQAGRERIYFNPLQVEDLSDRLCRAVWGHLEEKRNSYCLRDVPQTIEAAMLAVKASLDNEKAESLNGPPGKAGQGKAEKVSNEALELFKLPISKLIKCGEGHTIEFKETLEYAVKKNEHSQNLNRECLKTIAAFLNTDGGTLLIGVKDNGEVTGIGRDLQYVQRKNKDGFELKMRDLSRNHLDPAPLGKVKVSFEKLERQTVCRIDVSPASLSQIIHLDKDVYVREGNTTAKLAGRGLTDWIQQRAQAGGKGDGE